MKNTQKKVPKSTVGIDYLEGTLSDDALKEIEDCLHTASLSLYAHSHKPKHIAGIEDFFAQVSIVLSPDVVAAICTGLITSGVYDVIKKALCFIYSNLKTKKLTKIQNGKITENVTPTVHFTIGKNHAVLPLDISDEKFCYFVDGFFKAVSAETVTKEQYIYFDREQDGLVTYTKEEISQKSYQEWLESQKRSDDN